MFADSDKMHLDLLSLCINPSLKHPKLQPWPGWWPHWAQYCLSTMTNSLVMLHGNLLKQDPAPAPHHPLTCPELVVGATLQHWVTFVGTAGEAPLSPPARGKVPGSAPCSPGHLISFVRAGTAQVLGDLLRSLVRREPGACLSCLSIHTSHEQ